MSVMSRRWHILADPKNKSWHRQDLTCGLGAILEGKPLRQWKWSVSITRGFECCLCLSKYLVDFVSWAVREGIRHQTQGRQPYLFASGFAGTPATVSPSLIDDATTAPAATTTEDPMETLGKTQLHVPSRVKAPTVTYPDKTEAG